MHARRNPETESHAIVIGGSIAGLFAAGVLASHFDRVTVLERDRLVDSPEVRAGVPHARHVHGLLLRGRQLMDELFPGVEEVLAEAGALNVDFAADFAALGPAGWFVRFPSNLSALACTRALLEWAVRRQLSAFPQVRLLDETAVTGLLPASDGQSVRGVTIRRGGREERLEANLVVDASGRHSRSPAWLEALGFAAPEESIVDAHLGYASRIYERPADYKADWKVLLVLPTPPATTRLGLLMEVEGGRWMLSLMGGDHDYPPTDEAGLLDFVRSLRSPAIYNAIKDAAPLSSIHGFRGTENRLRHFERLERLPDGFVALGDAVGAFNPAYGQGMTIAAIGAMRLRECLAEQRRISRDGTLSGLSRRFQTQLAKELADPWAMAIGEDYRYRTTEGVPPGPATKFMRRYVDHVLALCSEDVAVRQVLMEVQNMIRPAPAMFAPGILFRVLRRAARLRMQNGSRIPAPHPDPTPVLGRPTV
ncbi:MAG TPA: FAD-dependent monooxygenase [Ardenticatenaceae bacterium]|nr:FAD-dependent monooxygenase [Ardenticatenaceae bacterium]